MNRWLECLTQKWAHYRQQRRYDILSGELDTALRDSANLAVYIGRLNARREEMKREMNREGA